MDAVGIVEPYELRFSDLILLSSDEDETSPEEIERLELVRRAVMENLGPTGPGLLSITGVPNATTTLRKTLLPLARNLALLSPDDQKRILKEHSLGSDVPLKNLDRLVSSFAMQLKYVQSIGNKNSGASHERDDVERWRELHNSKFSSLQDSFKELGYCMMELGLRLARVCDRAIGGQELEQSLLESCTAKGRLIHYHSDLDNLILKEGAKRKESTKKRREIKFHTQRSENGERLWGSDSILWQQWHYDYGIFTVLTDPMFILPCSSHSDKLNGCYCKSCEQECSSPSGLTYLQIFDPNKNSVLMVKTSPESFVVQVGESADILSRGKLRATLHSVCRPQNLKDLSRETFVVFLQPAWSKTLSLSDYPIEHFLPSGQSSGECRGETRNSDSQEQLSELALKLSKMVPPLSSRLKDGMTFAEFSRETTKQYYGDSGLQCNR